MQPDRPFLAGETAGLADCRPMNIWWLDVAAPAVAEPLMAGLDRLKAWRARMVAIGRPAVPMTPTEALDAARTAEPATYAEHDASDPLGLAPGAAVIVMADDYGRDRIVGTLVAANASRVIIAREDPALGRLQQHFPRVGYFQMPGLAALALIGASPHVAALKPRRPRWNA